VVCGYRPGHSIEPVIDFLIRRCNTFSNNSKGVSGGQTVLDARARATSKKGKSYLVLKITVDVNENRNYL